MKSVSFNNSKPIQRKVDSVGRISIPPKLLDHLSIEEGSSVLIHMDNDKQIILKKDINACVLCGSPDVIVDSTEIEICSNCRKNPDNISQIVDKRYEKQIIPNGRRLVIPFKIRNQLKIQTGDKIEIQLQDGQLQMEKVEDEAK